MGSMGDEDWLTLWVLQLFSRYPPTKPIRTGDDDDDDDADADADADRTWTPHQRKGGTNNIETHHFPPQPPQLLRLSMEIGAYVGYSAMNVARTVRHHGGKVASLEVDPLHVTLVRNMLEYAGLSEVVDVWTGHWEPIGIS